MINRVLITNGYVSANAGDAALLAVCVQQVRSAFPTAEVWVASLEDPDLVPTYEGAHNIGSIRRYVSDDRHALPIRLLRRLVGVLLGVLYLVLPTRCSAALRRPLPAEVAREASLAADCDLVVSMGGGYVHGRGGLAGWQNLYFVLLPMLIAQHHRRRTIFAPQSFGPFDGGPLQELLIRHTLGRSQLVIAREDKSVAALVRCGVPRETITRGVDAAFSLQPAQEPTDRMLPPKAVGLTARQWLPDHEQHRYELALARTIDQLTARGFRPVLVPQVTAAYTADDDRIVERRIADLCATAPTRLDEQLPYDVLFRLYGECEFFVGTRFHSVIFALLHRVPCLAIEYEHKTSGIMNDLGLGEWSIPIEDATDERVSALADRLIASRDSYLAQLDAVLPDYVARSRLFVHQLRETVSTREADQLAV